MYLHIWKAFQKCKNIGFHKMSGRVESGHLKFQNTLYLQKRITAMTKTISGVVALFYHIELQSLQVEVSNVVWCGFFLCCIAGDNNSFPSLNGLRNHINSCHLPKRFTCELCTYKTNLGGHLTRHHMYTRSTRGLTLQPWKSGDINSEGDAAFKGKKPCRVTVTDSQGPKKNTKNKNHNKKTQLF